jgi:two-component system, OmpR family, catabolic regulation response regulator CreB
MQRGLEILQTILLIEDENSIADMVLYALKSEGFATEWFRLGREGLSWLQQHSDAALLILDVGLPDGNGFELCKEIRRFSEIPIVFLTARNDEVDRIVGLEIGGDDYVGKPFSPRELTARVKAILKRGRIAVAPIGEKRATFEVDSARCRIRYHDVWLELTHYEYEVMRTLLRHPERVYSRAQIMDLVWSEPDESLERSVDTHIKTLRAKLRQVREDENPIKTHRGLGYSVSGSVDES